MSVFKERAYPEVTGRGESSKFPVENTIVLEMNCKKEPVTVGMNGRRMNSTPERKTKTMSSSSSYSGSPVELLLKSSRTQGRRQCESFPPGKEIIPLDIGPIIIIGIRRI